MKIAGLVRRRVSCRRVTPCLFFQTRSGPRASPARVERERERASEQRARAESRIPAPTPSPPDPTGKRSSASRSTASSASSTVQANSSAAFLGRKFKSPIASEKCARPVRRLDQRQITLPLQEREADQVLVGGRGDSGLSYAPHAHNLRVARAPPVDSLRRCHGTHWDGRPGRPRDYGTPSCVILENHNHGGRLQNGFLIAST